MDRAGLAGKAARISAAILRVACARIEVARDENQGGAKKGQLGGTHNPERVRVTFADALNLTAEP
jgi:hypothetical protein